jgi:hypothetical protein
MKVKGTFGDWYDRVEVDGRLLTPSLSRRVINHSPAGFGWGYGGSGPAQLALAILLEAGLGKDEASAFHQAFKWEFIAPLPQEADFYFEVDLGAWLARQREQVRRRAL